MEAAPDVQYKFDPDFFQDMFLKEKKLATQIPDKIDKIMKKVTERMERMNRQEEVVSKRVFENLSEDLNNLTVADVYRYALNQYTQPDDMFNCGIERTKLLLGPKLFTDSYTVYLERLERAAKVSQAKVLGRDESQDDLRAQVEAEIKLKAAELSKVDYIKVIIFKKFYEYLKTYKEFDKERIYRFFIRLLGLADGFAVIYEILLKNFDSVLRLTSVKSSTDSSPDLPQSEETSKSDKLNNQNILQVSQVIQPQQPQQPQPSMPSTSVSFTSVLFYRFFRFNDTGQSLDNSGPFSIQLEYDLVKMSNHPFDMLFYTLFEMNKYFERGTNITPDSIIIAQKKNIKREESLFTRTFKGFQYIGGRTKITSKKRHRKIKYKKSKSKTKITNSRRYSSRSMSKSRRS